MNTREEHSEKQTDGLNTRLVILLSVAIVYVCLYDQIVEKSDNNLEAANCCTEIFE